MYRVILSGAPCQHRLQGVMKGDDRSIIALLRNTSSMVTVAQLVEPRIVIPVVVGSSPISHPIFSCIMGR